MNARTSEYPVPGPDAPKGARIAHALNTAALARLTLAGKLTFGGFWQMPAGRPHVELCWRGNMDTARRLNIQGDAA